jgi:putative transposase
MAKKKKHSQSEIASKLAQADELEMQGKLQSQIAQALGVSVMTLHRWRKMDPQRTKVSSESVVPVERTRVFVDDSSKQRGDQTAALRVENAQLRRLVTDLLLEKMTLEEAIRHRQSAGRRRASC